ncbi:winged helix-turn-helix transcriptional regulator [Peredibacter sp. HCB2-198]|uniref:winged helix-turn-helix transcriptional regulator n=1 Tax=Peredibacter sp. HCB2-198 TaxID=3383025 RepID=UPI0038B4F17F
MAKNIIFKHDEKNCEMRSFLDRVADKWSLYVIMVLSNSEDQRARFSDLKKTIPGISQRMLTTTLRNLERDGLLTREVFAEVPPRVEYQLTALGKNLMIPVGELMGWIGSNWKTIQNAREKFDRGTV